MLRRHGEENTKGLHLNTREGYIINIPSTGLILRLIAATWMSTRSHEMPAFKEERELGYPTEHCETKELGW